MTSITIQESNKSDSLQSIHKDTTQLRENTDEDDTVEDS